MKGKVGNVVFRIRRGTQVMSQYNPEVDNPNTDKQVAARSRMKLMSQLSAIYATIIAMPRIGAVTSRNQFTKTNYPLSSSNGEKAIVDLPNVQLTKSAREMPAFTVSRSNGTEIQCALVQAANFSRVVYAIVAKNANENLRVFTSAVVENTEGVENTFAVKMPYTAEAIVVYAYALTDNNGRSKSSFGNISAPTAQEIAQLITSRSLLSSDYSVTATGGAYLEVGTADAVSEASTGNAGAGGNGNIPTVPTIGGYSPFSEFTDVVLSAQNGASIYYTLNGDTPTTASALYSEPIRITETTTVKAIAVVNNISSNVSTRTLTKENAPVVVVPPTISGTTPFSESTQVTMSAEAGARIFYTTDGSEPNSESATYDNPITITATTTFKAKAYLQGEYSAVTTKTFTKGGGGDDPFAG